MHITPIHHTTQRHFFTVTSKHALHCLFFNPWPTFTVQYKATGVLYQIVVFIFTQITDIATKLHSRRRYESAKRHLNAWKSKCDSFDIRVTACISCCKKTCKCVRCFTISCSHSIALFTTQPQPRPKIFFNKRKYCGTVIVWKIKQKLFMLATSCHKSPESLHPGYCKSLVAEIAADELKSRPISSMKLARPDGSFDEDAAWPYSFSAYSFWPSNANLHVIMAIPWFKESGIFMESVVALLDILWLQAIV